jgi:hypothetical protein
MYEFKGKCLKVEGASLYHKPIAILRSMKHEMINDVNDNAKYQVKRSMK